MLEKLISFENGNLILAILGILIGAILGEVLPKIPDNPGSWELWLLISVCIISVFAIGSHVFLLNLQRKSLKAQTEEIKASTAKMYDSNQKLVSNIDDLIGNQAKLIPRNLIYKEMAACINSAESEVIVITYLSVNWETNEKNWGPAANETPYRDLFYKSIIKAIKNPKVSYLRVWQVPPDKHKDAYEIIISDKSNEEEYNAIKEIESHRPDKARMVIANQLTTASFILIDRKNLFFNIDIYDPIKESWESPYMLFIKDVTSESFESLQAVIAKLKPN